MVPKSGRGVRFFGAREVAAAIGQALSDELGGSRRATKTIMAWAGVSDHTARSWLQGRSCPDGYHLLLLASRSSAVMRCVLRLSGHDDIGVALDLASTETALAQALESVRRLRNQF